MNNILVIPALVLILTVGLAPAYAQNDNDYLQKWKDYVESYKDYLESYKGYMEEYKKWAYDKFNDYEDEIKELKSMNENLSNVILDKDGEIIKVTDQSIRLGTIESGILNNIKMQEMQLVIDSQQEKIINLANRVSSYEVDMNYTEQLKTSWSHSKNSPVPVAPVSDNDIIKTIYFDNGRTKSYAHYFDNGNLGSITEFYDDRNRDVKSLTEYYESGNPARVYEYSMNRIIKSNAIYYDTENLELKTMIQYYDNEELKSRISYDKNGNVKYANYYDENGNKTYDDGYQDGSKEIIKSTPKLIINELPSYVKVDQDRYVEGDMIKINGLVGIVLPSKYDIEILINTRIVDGSSSGWTCYSLESDKAGDGWVSNDFIMSDDGLFSVSCKISDTASQSHYESDYFTVDVRITDIKQSKIILELISNEFLIVQDKNNS